MCEDKHHTHTPTSDILSPLMREKFRFRGSRWGALHKTQFCTEKRGTTGAVFHPKFRVSALQRSSRRINVRVVFPFSPTKCSSILRRSLVSYQTIFSSPHFILLPFLFFCYFAVKFCLNFVSLCNLNLIVYFFPFVGLQWWTWWRNCQKVAGKIF